MPSLRLAPFDDSCLDAAATLLAARHRRDRAHEPALPERFMLPDAARVAVLAAWREVNVHGGIAAWRGERLVGFLIGAPDLREIWGRSVWVRYAGHALAADEAPDLYRDLYAVAAPQWLARGYFAHYVELPADDQASLNLWFQLSFGTQQAYAIRPLAAIEVPNPPHVPAITIRRAGSGDTDVFVELQKLLWGHLGRSPVYSVRLPEDLHGAHEDAAATLADPQVAVWLAEQDGATVGAVEMRPLTSGDDLLDVPEQCCYFAFAATRLDARGRGIGTLLTAHALREAHTAGYVAALTNWRTTNTQAARLWPHLGFRPFQYRLHRLIDHRIAWSPSFPN